MLYAVKVLGIEDVDKLTEAVGATCGLVHSR